MAKYIGRHRRTRPQRPVTAANPAGESNTRKADEREPALAGG